MIMAAGDEKDVIMTLKERSGNIAYRVLSNWLGVVGNNQQLQASSDFELTKVKLENDQFHLD